MLYPLSYEGGYRSLREAAAAQTIYRILKRYEQPRSGLRHLGTRARRLPPTGPRLQRNPLLGHTGLRLTKRPLGIRLGSVRS